MYRLTACAYANVTRHLSDEDFSVLTWFWSGIPLDRRSIGQTRHRVDVTLVLCNTGPTWHQSDVRCITGLLHPRSTVRSSRTIRSAARRTQWSEPIKLRVVHEFLLRRTS